METVVEVVGNDERKLEDGGVEKSSSTLSSPKQVADSVVYKLVRVEGDGRLVPATDDEIMQVEGLLIGGKGETHSIPDSAQIVGCISNEGSSSGMLQLESSEGLSQSDHNEVCPEKLNAHLEYIEEMLQKVKEEERLRLAHGSSDYSSPYDILDCQYSDRHDKFPGIDETLQSKIPLQENAPSLEPSPNRRHLNQSGSIGECSNRPDKLQGGSSSSAVATTSRPDFSMLKGEISLDKLSIKELHEMFKGTFGRETTVKDKQWLKRRIAMGLTHTYDVVTTTLIFKDNELLEKGVKGSCNNMDSSSTADPATILKDSLVNHGGDWDNKVEKVLGNSSIDDKCGNEDQNPDQGTSKRIRKPTKRYIEELSEVESKESSKRMMTSAKASGLRQALPMSHLRPVRRISIDGRIITTRVDSFGGSGIRVPCVSRVRRSRPRKNFMALLRFHPSSIGMAATLVKKTVSTPHFQPDNGSGNKVMTATCAVGHVQPHVAFQSAVVPEKDTRVSAVGVVGVGHNMDLRHVDSSRDMESKVVTAPTLKDGIRRKHHRAWTLSEVVKLVDGVSKFGAGRWSEIKRLAFASYSHRTSVDLKDKWRNLLKASVAKTPADNGMASRKGATSVPIPASLLSRVKELAEMQARVAPNLSSGKVAGSTVKTVNEKQSGYL